MEKYLQEAFKAFEELNEDVFDISTVDGLEKAKEFEDEPVWDDREEEIIIDPLAETEEELQKDYIGKAILQCEICQSMIYKNPDEVVIDEETELANVDEVCPFCQSEDGFKVIGEIKEFRDDEECEEKHEEEEAEESEEPVEEKSEEVEEVEEPIEDEEEIEESIKTRKRVRTENLKEAQSLKAKMARKAQKDPLDDIDAEKDNKIEKAKNEFKKAKDDADSDKDYKLKKKGLKESKLNEGFRGCKEVKMIWHGNYSDPELYYKDEDGTEYYANYYDVENSMWDYYLEQADEDESGKYTFDESDEDFNKFIVDNEGSVIRDVIDFSEYNNYDHSDDIDESCKSKRPLKRKVNEDFNKVDIETDTQKMSMESDENGKVTVTTEPKVEEAVAEEGAEVIAPVSDEVKAEFKTTDEIEEPEEIDYDFDEFEEKDFDSLGEGFLKRVYENVKSFKTTEGRLKGNNLMLEGLITFKSGKQAKTNFVFEAYKATKTGKLKFIGENKQFAKGKKSFTLSGRADGKKLVCESLNYNYVAKSADGNSKRLYGTIKK